MFLSPRKPQTTVFTRVFAFGNKNHIIYGVFWTAPSKTIGIYAVAMEAAHMEATARVVAPEPQAIAGISGSDRCH
jgi:hypothetical protein